MTHENNLYDSNNPICIIAFVCGKSPKEEIGQIPLQRPIMKRLKCYNVLVFLLTSPGHLPFLLNLTTM